MTGKLSRISTAVFLFLFATMVLGSEVVRMVEELQENKEQALPVRRRLAGPGSSPPTCHGRCARCSPCRPVHVAIQPGRSMPLEYYPEAWRCKCGSKLFMP